MLNYIGYFLVFLAFSQPTVLGIRGRIRVVTQKANAEDLTVPTDKVNQNGAALSDRGEAQSEQRSNIGAADQSGDLGTFVPPPPNACQSKYDRFYESEPGVYAYWALCESGSKLEIYDYAGQWDLVSAPLRASVPAFGWREITGGHQGPVPDDETAAQVSSAAYAIESQNIPLNKNEGTVATWINADSTDQRVSAVFFGAVKGKSSISIGTSNSGSACFNGSYVDVSGTVLVVEKCGFVPNRWHRLVFTWSGGEATLFVDGSSVASGAYTAEIDNKVFYYRLFPLCPGIKEQKQMTLAKALVANEAWSPAQVSADYRPTFLSPPAGGVYVTTKKLGTIHRDVLGYADYNANMSSPPLVSALVAGLGAAGVTSLRYANGSGGLLADVENWQGERVCSHDRGETTSSRHIATRNSLDNYIRQIAEPLGLDICYTVNYGTNPPYCNAGGDPAANGANLVEYAKLHHYAIKYWEIGNELFSPTTEADFHPDPNTGASYVKYEPAFYDTMKDRDDSVSIAVPIGGTNYATQTNFDLPVLAGAKYDAIVYHNYPIVDPVSDGSTLYSDRVLANVGRIRGALLTLQTELLSNGKDPDAIWITEWNGDSHGGKWSKQSMGAVMPLFVATQLAEYMQAGVRYANWWAQGETNVCSHAYYDFTGKDAYNWWDCGSLALVYTGPIEGVEVRVGLRAGDLMPAARGFQVLSESGFVREGEHMLRTITDPQRTPWLEAYAATHGSSYAILLINRDRDNTHTVPVVVAGAAPGRMTQQWTYGRAQYDQSHAGKWSAGPTKSVHGPWSGGLEVTLPPWSVNVIVFGQ